MNNRMALRSMIAERSLLHAGILVQDITGIVYRLVWVAGKEGILRAG